MSYSITVSGHKTFADAVEAKDFEEQVAARAAEFVAGLEGVTSSWFSGSQVSRSLMPPEGDQAATADEYQPGEPVDDEVAGGGGNPDEEDD